MTSDGDENGISQPQKNHTPPSSTSPRSSPQLPESQLLAEMRVSYLHSQRASRIKALASEVSRVQTLIAVSSSYMRGDISQLVIERNELMARLQAEMDGLRGV
jgi:hypothetical protein